jgi:Do/DeqQ family serine protease
MSREFESKNMGFQVVGTLLIALLAGFTLLACKGQGKTRFDAPAAAQPASLTSASVAGYQSSYADVVSRVAPAVVTVRSTERARQAQQYPFGDDPFFRQFFGDRLPQQPPQRVQGLGSGVVINSDGHILTNFHVIDGAVEIKVEMTDNRTYTAKVVGSDQPSDLALLKIEANNLPSLTLGDSDKVRVGDVVLAVGNPLGVGQTVTAGIISAKGRATGLSDGSFEDFLQTDAAINRGNSGGALVNTTGELVGINSQIISPSGGNIGIGFAIPSNMARAVLDQLLKTGKVKRGMIGVTIQAVSADLAASLNLPAARGAMVNSVQAGGPAEKAGIKMGDVITAFNDSQVIDNNNLRNLVASTAPGTDVTLTILRDGHEQRVTVKLAELPARAAAAGEQQGDQESEETGKYGLTVEPLTPELASRLGLKPTDQGVVVSQVDPNGPAAEAQIQQGDVIQEVNRQAVRNANELRAALGRSGARPALVLVNRRGRTVYLTLRPRQ